MTGSMFIGALIGLAFGVAIYVVSDRYFVPSLHQKYASEGTSAAKRALLESQIKRMKFSLMLNIPLSAVLGAFVLPALTGAN